MKRRRRLQCIWLCVVLGSVLTWCPILLWAAPDVGADLMFVIDNSGSMRKNDPNFIMPKAVHAFLEQLPSQIRVGMILFDQEIRLVEPLSDITNPQARQLLISKLDMVDYKGRYTHSPAGIERALQELKTAGHKDAQKYIIFLTDGIVDTGQQQKDQELRQWLMDDLAAESRALGIRIFGIAFADNADAILIQALATRTGGASYQAYEAKHISDVLDQIKSELSFTSISELASTPKPIESDEHKPEQIKKPIDSAVVSDPKQPSVSKPNRFWKLYLPVTIVILVLLGVLIFFLRIKFHRHSVAGGAQSSPEPFQMGEAPPASPPEWQLQDLDGAGVSDSGMFNFNKKSITIGRSDKNDIAIPQSTISGLHAIIEYRDGFFQIEDQRSTNGTFLNDRKVLANKPLRLKSGDRIKFANFEFKFVQFDQLLSGDTVMLSATAMGVGDKVSIPVIPEKSAQLDLHDETDLYSCFEQHLEQIKALGPKYEEFVNRYFSNDTIQTLCVQAYENMQQNQNGHEEYYATLIRKPLFYVVCTPQLTMAETNAWFRSQFDGFIQFISSWIKAETYQNSACDTLCIITMGCDQQPWISLTIIPTHDNSDPVEIMSVDFLTQEEKASLGLDFDDQGRAV